MFKNYFKIAYRKLIKNKLNSAINIGGLVIGFTIGIAILLAVYNQFSYDRFNSNRKKIYQAYQVFNNPDGEDIENAFGYAQAPVYKAGAQAIDKITRFTDGGNHIEYKGVDKQIPITLVDEDFLNMFTFPILKGNRLKPLASLTDAVLTEEAAKRLFGNEDPIGKTIKANVGGKMQLLVVSALVKDIVNSSIHFGVLARIENRASYTSDLVSWGDRSPYMYVQLKEGATAQQAEAQLRQLDKKYVPNWYQDLKKKGARPDKYGDLFATRLLPLNEVHFSTRINGNHAVSYMQMITLMTVGLFILFIACFNFININLASGFTRSREIGVRKCLGAENRKLFLQLWIECFMICAIAFICSLLLVNTLLHSINGLDQFRQALLNDIWKPGFLCLSLLLLFFTSLMAGGYPSLLMTRFKVVDSLKGRISMKLKSGLRSSLIVTQFVIACIMISCTYIIYQQYQYLQNADLGINKSYLISVPLHQPDKGWQTIEKLRGRLVSNPHILSISGSNINLGRGSDHRTSKISTDFTYSGRQIHTNIASIDYEYLKTFGLRPIEGRDFDKSFISDTLNRIIISESVAKQLNEKNLIGKIIGADSNFKGWQVVGVFPDFHLYSMEEPLEPLSLTLDTKAPLNYCFIKTSSGNPIAAMNDVKKEMALLEPGQEFTGTFVDENVDNWYQGEKAMSVLFSIAAVVAILLSCSGLLAIVLLVIQQRVKEIGVRKVLGAGIKSIAFLIAKEFLWLVLLAVLIATPIAWFAMNKWLSDFPYRIQIRASMFVFVSFVAILIAGLTIGINTVRAAMQNPVKSLRTE
jgi:ABC-type antimicrobial peptide transport system permease subunit